MSEHILQLMIQERDRLSAAISALQGFSSTAPPAAPEPKPAPLQMKPAPAKAKRKMSAEGRAKIVAAAKKRWKLIKAGIVPSPFAKKKAA